MDLSPELYQVLAEKRLQLFVFALLWQEKDPSWPLRTECLQLRNGGLNGESLSI